MTDLNSIIDGLTEDLTPVKPLKPARGLSLVTAAMAATLAALILLQGLWSGIFQGEASAVFIITNGLFFVLGLAAALATVKMANPHVGARYDGPKWAAFMSLTLPVTGLIALFTHGNIDAQFFNHGLLCSLGAGLSSLLIAASLVVWLRRGAVASPRLAGMTVGLAAGALGTAIYGLSCPLDNIAHLGIWHALPIALACLMGSITVPRLIHW